MGLLRTRLYEIRSPLRFLQTGRGLGRLSETIELKIRNGLSQGDQILSHRQRDGEPVREFADFLLDSTGNRIQILGLRPAQDNLLAFEVPAFYEDSREGPKEAFLNVDIEPGEPRWTTGSLLSRIDILYVSDWLDFVRRLEKDLEAEIRSGSAQPRDTALHDTVTSLQLEDCTRPYFNALFSFENESWLGLSVNDLVNARSGEASTSIAGSQIDIKTVLRKPGGGRFGKVEFDFELDAVVNPSTNYGFNHTFMSHYEHSDIDFRFTRPGLLSVTDENQQQLSDLFQSLWVEEGVDGKVTGFRALFIPELITLWQQIMTDYAFPRAYRIFPEVDFKNAGIARQTLTRRTTAGGRPLWRNIPARRPYLTGCIVRHWPGTSLEQER